MVKLLVTVLMILLAEHLYIPVSTLIALINSVTVTLVTLPLPVGDFDELLGLNLLLLPRFCHAIVGTGKPVAVHVICIKCPSMTLKFCLSIGVMSFGPTVKAKNYEMQLITSNLPLTVNTPELVSVDNTLVALHV